MNKRALINERPTSLNKMTDLLIRMQCDLPQFIRSIQRECVPCTMEISERFVLLKRLGSQRNRKFGEVFLAIEKLTAQQVVLKTIAATEDNEHIMERLRAEARFTFDFPGLPKTIQYEESGTEIFLIRSFHAGVPLDVYWSKLKRRRRLPFLVDFVGKLIPIFNHLAAAGIAHCDIKPSNILISPNNLTGFDLHLLDFGLALRRDETEINRARKLLFPLGFAAPELLLNRLELVDQRTDIFALGIVIWKLYAEKLPLTHPNPSVFTNLQLTHPLPEHSEISRRLQRILAKMCAKHSFNLPPNQLAYEDVNAHLLHAMEQRYHSLEEVHRDLKAINRRRWW